MCSACCRKLVGRLGHKKAILAVAHGLCRLTWRILHQGVRYIEYGMRLNANAVQKRARRLECEPALTWRRAPWPDIRVSMPDTSDLPGDLHLVPVSFDRETAISDLSGTDGLGELVAFEIDVCFKGGHRDLREKAGV